MWAVRIKPQAVAAKSPRGLIPARCIGCRAAGARRIIANCPIFKTKHQDDPRHQDPSFRPDANGVISVAPDQADTAIILERPKQAAHGDFACNLAMQLARAMKRNPRELAQLLLSEILKSPFVGKTEIAGAGFINFHLLPAAKFEVVRTVLAQGAAFGRSTVGGKKKVQVEFVSANPTGPLHVGHGRGAPTAPAFQPARLRRLGRDARILRERRGRQMDILAVSAGCAISISLVKPCPSRPTPTRATTCATWPSR